MTPLRAGPILAAVLLVSATGPVGCGPSASVGDASFASSDDAGAKEPEPPPAPTFEGHPSPFPYTVASLRGKAPRADRVIVTGRGNPLMKATLADKTFCVDVPMPVPDEYTFEVVSHTNDGLESAPAQVTVTFDPKAPEPDPGWTTCSGADPGPCPRDTEICDDGQDNDCDGRKDAQDPDCSDCEDDAFENNDDVSAPRVEATRHDGLRVCPGDADFYGVAAEKGDTIDVRVFFSHAEGNLDLALYDVDASSVVARSETMDDDESVSHEATSAGEHVIHIHGVDGSSASYALDIEVTSSGS